MIKVGDYVTRNSYNNDIIFKVVSIEDGICYLEGVCVRLSADSPISDLVKYDGDLSFDNFGDNYNEFDSLDRGDYFYIPGVILHIDGDKSFLDRSMDFYKKNKIKAYGVFLSEDLLPKRIGEYLNKYNPDILVVTGYDSLYRK